MRRWEDKKIAMPAGGTWRICIYVDAQLTSHLFKSISITKRTVARQPVYAANKDETNTGEGLYSYYKPCKFD